MKNILYTFIIISLFSCQEFVNQTKGNGQVTTTKREVTENFTKIETSEAIAVEINKPKTTVLKLKRILIYKIMLKQLFQMVF